MFKSRILLQYYITFSTVRKLSLTKNCTYILMNGFFLIN
jgi:hypothetical protein